MEVECYVHVHWLEDDDRFGTCRMLRNMYYPLTVVAKICLTMWYLPLDADQTKHKTNEQKEKNEFFIIYGIL